MALSPLPGPLVDMLLIHHVYFDHNSYIFSLDSISMYSYNMENKKKIIRFSDYIEVHKTTTIKPELIPKEEWEKHVVWCGDKEKYPVFIAFKKEKWWKKL